MKKILYSAGVIAFVAAIAYGATGAFFSDSETSTGNILAAGAIDLGIDNHSYYNGVLNPETTWRIDYDIDGGDDQEPGSVRQFFNFDDLKPGDWGEDTISIHVKNNDAYVCADITLTSDDDNDITEPEADDGDVGPAGVGNGDLADGVNFYWWADDGDNVLETDEEIISSGPIGALAVGATTSVALADSEENIWTGVGGPLASTTVDYVGKAWCFGEANVASSTYAQDGGNQGSGPDDRQFVCDGAGVNNLAQTDSLTATIAFRAVQSRNNGQFVCSPEDGPTEPTTGSITVDKVVTFTDDLIAGVDVTDFQLHINGPGGDQIVTDQVETFGLAPGVYTVSEVYSGDPANVTFDAVFSGSCSEIPVDTNTGTMTLLAGGDLTCTITNTVTLIPE